MPPKPADPALTSVETRFGEYAHDHNVKLKPGADAILQPNRYKLWRRAYGEVIRSIPENARVLDFGCGTGEFLDFVAQNSKAELTGYEVSSSQLERARARFGRTKIRFFERLEDLVGKFDFVFCHHVVEHVPDSQMDDFITKVTSFLRPGGKLVMSTPNGLNPYSYAYYMSSDRTHLRMHSPFTLAEILRPTGLEIVEVKRETPQMYDFATSAKYMVWLIFSSILARLTAYSVAGGVRGLRFGLIMASTFFVVAQRPESPSLVDGNQR